MADKKRPLLQAIKYLLFLAIGLLLLYLAFKGHDLNQLVEDLKHANYYWVAISLVLGISAYISRAQRWLILLEPMGYHPKVSNSIYSVIVGYFANLAVPRIGEITRCTAMNQAENIPVDKLFGTVILERVIDFAILLTITLVTILININLFGSFFFDLFSSNVQGGGRLTSILIIISISFAVLLALLFFFRKKLMQLSFVIKIRSFIKGIKDGFIAVRKLKKKRWFIFHTLLIWTFYYLMAYVCFFSIEATSNLTPLDGLFVLAVGGFGMAAPVQGGIGAYHYIVSLGLGVLAVEYSDALLFATIVHTSQTILTLVAGAVALLMLYINKRKAIKLKKSSISKA